MVFTLETTIALISAGGVGGILVAVVTYFLEKKRTIELNALSRKEEQYKKFLENIIAFFTGWENGERKKIFMEELYTHAPLYASNKVIRLANDFLESHSTEKSGKFDKKTSEDLYKNLVLEIRKDMGLSVRFKDNLTKEDIKILKLND